MATGLSNVGRVTSVVDPSDTTKFFAIYEHNSASANLTMRVGAVQAQVTGAAIVGVQVNDIARGVGPGACKVIERLRGRQVDEVAVDPVEEAAHGVRVR